MQTGCGSCKVGGILELKKALTNACFTVCFDVFLLEVINDMCGTLKTYECVSLFHEKHQNPMVYHRPCSNLMIFRHTQSCPPKCPASARIRRMNHPAREAPRARHGVYLDPLMGKIPNSARPERGLRQGKGNSSKTCKNCGSLAKMGFTRDSPHAQELMFHH